MGHTSEFQFGIYWWTWKNYLLKKLLKKTNKNKRILIFQMLYFKKNTWRYHYFTSVYQKSWWYDLQFLRYGVRQSVTNWWLWSIFCPFTPPPPPNRPPKNPRYQNFEKMKTITGDIIILHKVPKTTITWGTVPEMCSETYRIFCYFGPFFALFPLPPPKKNNPENQNFENTKKVSREVIILHMCTKKSQSYYVCLVRFLRYGVWQI